MFKFRVSHLFFFVTCFLVNCTRSLMAVSVNFKKLFVANKFSSLVVQQVISKQNTPDYSRLARFPKTDSLRPRALWLLSLSKKKKPPKIQNFSQWFIHYLHSSRWSCICNVYPFELGYKVTNYEDPWARSKRPLYFSVTSHQRRRGVGPFAGRIIAALSCQV